MVQSEGVGHPAGCRRKGPHLGCWSRGWGGGGKASVPEQVRVRPRPPGSTAAVLTRAPMCPRAHAPAPGPADATLSARGVCRRDEGRRGHARAGRALHPASGDRRLSEERTGPETLGGRPCADGRSRSVGLASSGRGRRGPPLRLSGGVAPRPLDFGLLASGAVRGAICVVRSHPVCGILLPQPSRSVSQLRIPRGGGDAGPSVQSWGGGSRMPELLLPRRRWPTMGGLCLPGPWPAHRPSGQHGRGPGCVCRAALQRGPRPAVRGARCVSLELMGICGARRGYESGSDSCNGVWGQAARPRGRQRSLPISLWGQFSSGHEWRWSSEVASRVLGRLWRGPCGPTCGHRWSWAQEPGDLEWLSVGKAALPQRLACDGGVSGS